MSIKLMSMVWELQLRHDELIVLLSLADHARDDGSRCYPSVAYTAWKTGYSQRSIQRILRKLEEDKLIIPVRHARGGRGNATEYRIILANGRPKVPFQNGKNEATKQLRQLVIQRDEQTCQHCGQPGDDTNGPDGKAWHIDRVLPGAYGGQYTEDNVILSCASCNLSKNRNSRPRKGANLTKGTKGAKSVEQTVPNRPRKGASNTSPQPSLNHQEPLDKDVSDNDQIPEPQPDAESGAAQSARSTSRQIPPRKAITEMTLEERLAYDAELTRQIEQARRYKGAV